MRFLVSWLLITSPQIMKPDFFSWKGGGFGGRGKGRGDRVPPFYQLHNEIATRHDKQQCTCPFFISKQT